MNAPSSPKPVAIGTLLDALDSISGDPTLDAHAWLSRSSATVVYHSAYSDDSIDPLPQDIDDTDEWLELPSPKDLDLGRPLAFAFVAEYAPEDEVRVHDFFRRRGAYRHYKDWLAQRELLDAWHSFQRAATERALREWCTTHGVVLSD